MKQVTQNYKSGKIRVQEVNTPALRAGGVLVRTAYSLVSTGTEGMKAREGKMSVLAKARARPDQVKKVLESVQQQGLMPTYRKVINKLDSLTPLGYSIAGHVVAVGKGVTSLRVGQSVACAGVGYANHAEIDFVPENLVVPIPDGVALPDAALTTVGAIAMQSVRQANLQVGETACVIGLGLIGQLLVQILRAAGVRVIGVDLAEHRCELARRMGAQAALTPTDNTLHAVVDRMTDGHGVDGVFLAAGGSSNGPVELAVSIARDRAVVVDIGKMKLDLPWTEYYEKELTVRFSRSYGPGRYDPNYEEKGIDYPIGYVRWTERRNMSSFLNLIAEKRIEMAPLVGTGVPLEQASEVYDQLTGGQLSDVGVLFKYDIDGPVPTSPTPLPSTPVATRSSNRVRVGALGAGNYASSMLLPHLKKNARADMVEVATSTSLSAQNAAEKFGFQRTSTETSSLLSAADIDLIIVATRHASHARFVCDTLRQNKPVFVEKPLAIDFEGLESVRSAIVETGNDRLLVGFNRRYAPLVCKLNDVFDGKQVPLVMNYRVHAGQMGADAWYLDPDEGSRFVGEAGHFLDVFAFLTGASPVRVSAAALGGQSATSDDATNIAMTVEYSDGSIGNLTYLTQGGAKLPKEYIEVHGGGLSACLQNFESLEIFDVRARNRHSSRSLDKGQANQMDALIAAVGNGDSMPISAQSLIDTTLATLAAERSATTGQTIELADLWTFAAENPSEGSNGKPTPEPAAVEAEQAVTSNAERQ